jgi:hypothetical protein
MYGLDIVQASLRFDGRFCLGFGLRFLERHEA